MKKKGFTLIELLAVIVILAVIALIAVPVVLKVIENSRKSAAKTSALNYMKAVETYLVSSKLDNHAVHLKKGETYNCTENTIIEDEKTHEPYNVLAINELVELKGYRPTGSKDKIKLDENYRIESGEMTINGYTVSIKDREITSIVKGAKINVESIALNYQEQTMEKGSTFELKAIFTPKDTSDQRVTYASSDESVVTVSDTGLVKSKKNGTAKITVTSKDNTNKKAECNITVITSATSVRVEPSETEVEIGKTVQLVGTIEPGDVTTNALTWTSSDVSIAHVDENGLVTGMSVGSATITAKTVNGKETTSTITVKEVEAESVSLDKSSTTVKVNNTLQLNATINPSNTTNKTLTWTSSNTSVATVSSSGLVTGKTAGSATITVKTSNNKTATASITIEPECEYSVNQVFNYGYTGGVQTFTPKCTGKYKLEVWGAQGGSVSSSTSGGLGAYSYGSYTANANSTLYVVVGGQGDYLKTNSCTHCTQAGGYNGGGGATNYGHQGGGGGGATHIATRTGLLSSLTSYRTDILIVAGGGGGGSIQSYGTDTNGSGGAGGGYQGGTGRGPSNTGSPGNQTGGYAFGQGGTGSYNNQYYCEGGGGGGYYGGSGGVGTCWSSGGGGGSGYLNTSKLTSYGMYCYTANSSLGYATGCPTNSTYYTYGTTNYSSSAIANQAKQGHGYARITYLGK